MDVKKFDDCVLEFKDWLKDVRKQKNNSANSRVANINIIGESYDLLKEYALNKCERVFDELAFSKKDLFISF